MPLSVPPRYVPLARWMEHIGVPLVVEPIPLELLHRFHPYCARFPSELVEDALEKYSNPGDSIFDPFCGSGTTVVASLVKGRKVVGIDVDPLAVMISEVKCTPFAPERYAEWRARFAARLARDFGRLSQAWRPRPPPKPGALWSFGTLRLRIPACPELNHWFPQLPRLRPHYPGAEPPPHQPASDRCGVSHRPSELVPCAAGPLACGGRPCGTAGAAGTVL
jgi:DNA methylase